MFSTFYNESMRKLVIGFGSLFNNLNVRYFDSSGTETQKVRIPLSYSPKEKFIARLNEGGSILEDKTKVKAILPRLGFDITGINYDPTRTINKLKKMRKRDGLTTSSMFNEVPYNISFGLYAFTSSIDENLQVIEQILPYFSPEFIVSINMNSVHDKVDVPIVLSNINIQEEYEGNFLNRRFISTTFEFLAKSYVYGPITSATGGIITAITGDFYQSLDDTFNDESAVVASFGATGDLITGLSGPVYYPAQGRTH
jgi:hypothetical protein|tara:strand:+ start:122 stop:886 length:765 start_codon:yes stop_codon:yes gene_type:complete